LAVFAAVQLLLEHPLVLGPPAQSRALHLAARHLAVAVHCLAILTICVHHASGRTTVAAAWAARFSAISQWSVRDPGIQNFGWVLDIVK
jgi:hypothetical protein